MSLAAAFWQYQIPLVAVLLLFLVALFIPMEVGFQLGRLRKPSHPDLDEGKRSDITLTAMLTLLALMLAFTYSFSMSRADLRKKALIAEVNALGTAFLRADLLPEPSRTEVRQRLYDYAKSRHVEPGTITTLAGVEEFVARSLECQARIWPAVKSAIRQPGQMTAPEKALLISSVNGVFDSHSLRMAVFFDRLPTAVLLLLVLIAGTALAVAAYNASVTAHPNRGRLTMFAAILASLMYLILDFDMMMRGFIQVDHSSLIGLIEEMESALER